MPYLKSLPGNPAVHRSPMVLVKATAVVALLALGGAAWAENAPNIRAEFRLTALETEIDEGDVAQFIIRDKEYLDPGGAIMKFEADLSPVEWDFGDGRQDPVRDYRLYDMKHWFADDRDDPYTVRAAHQGTTEEIRITVNDVLPVIVGISVTENPQKDRPVMFQAAVYDPGFNDEIIYTWDFGGGATETGRNAVHTWDETGVYEITLSVEDKDRNDPPDTLTFHITVGDDQYYTDNTFSAFGDFSRVGAEIDGLLLVGTNGNVTEPNAGGSCQIRIEMRSSDSDMGVVLTAHLDPGLAPGHYTIGKTEEWAGTHAQDVASTGTFFAEFIPPGDEAYRMVGGKKIGGPFWSDSGSVTVEKFEAGMLELTFRAVMTENTPATISEPRQVAVMGKLVTSIPEAVTASDITGPADARKIPGLDLLAKSVLSIGQDAPDPEDNIVNSKYYSCAGEEPGEFEIVAGNPTANAVSFPFEKPVVEVEFSQSVDADTIVHPDTLEDNLLLGVRGREVDLWRVGGSWLISKENPKVVQFIPQSRLMPGTVHCVYVKGGEKGLRSFTGNLFSGSSMEAPRNQLAEACIERDDYTLSHAFSTRVELESIGVQVYQTSLSGPHSRIFVRSGDYETDIGLVRVYPWWQNAVRTIHPSAAVKEFEARVFAVVDRQRLDPEVRAGETGQTRIKRPDLYSDDAKRNMLHSIEFEYDPGLGANGTVDVFSVIQPLNEAREPVEPVDPSVVRQVETAAPLPVKVGILTVSGDCSMDLGGVCDPPNGVLLAGWLNGWGSKMFPFMKFEFYPFDDVIIEMTDACPAGIVNEVCFSGFQERTESAEGGHSYLQHLAAQIMDDPSVFREPRPDFDVLIALLPAGMMPDAATDPVKRYERDNSRQQILFADLSVGTFHFKWLDLSQEIARTLLRDERCTFSGNSICDTTPVQGVLSDRDGIWNKHHAEGNQHGGPLIPLLKNETLTEENWTNFYISAYNYAKLREVVECLNRPEGCD